MEVSTSVTRRLGIDWLLSRPNTVVQTNFGGGGNVLVGVQSGKPHGDASRRADAGRR